ncbi:MAG: hypothetical protein IGS03_05580 [Candidatus Sericytochromatia bacterium]|nr:hypothetical protein [Candidatus Sericytochromatia bacterium]
MPRLTNLRTEDYMAMTRAMDTNRNNRIDNNEVQINWNTHQRIGNSNGVAGTRELATALQNGDVFITGMSTETADKIAEYFSKRPDNFDRPVAEWISDAWISKEDFEFSPEVRSRVDSNNDNRVSRKELAVALASGALTIGQGRQVSNDPFQNPAQGRDPFRDPNPNGRDPFQNPGYDRPVPDSGAYIQIDMVKNMRSDYERSETLGKLARKTDLSPREQAMLADATVKYVSSDYSKGEILGALAANRSLSEEGAVRLAKSIRELSSDYTKGELINKLVNNHQLGFRAQESSIITIGTLSSDFTQAESFKNLIRSQDLDLQNKQLLAETVQKTISSSYSRQEIMNLLF